MTRARGGCGRLGLAGSFRRADVNADGKVDIVDPLATLFSIFLGQGTLNCRDAADTDDDGTLIVWGGTGGRRFDPTNGTWSAVTAVGQPSVRQSQSSVWTGTRMIVYGGSAGLADGAIYR